jgi:16S rRNA (uracil1498-N3)-methyltransferase
MRAIYLNNINDKDYRPEDIISVAGDQAKHLIKVVRIKDDEKLLVLNGEGLKLSGKVINIEKKSLEFQIERIEKVVQEVKYDLAICLPKKDATEEILRIATELGVNRLIPVFSDYSQMHFTKNARVESILESALIQSNNPYKLKLAEEVSFDELLIKCKDYQEVIYFSSQPFESSDGPKVTSVEKRLIVIGPEGGLSSAEEGSLKDISHVNFVHLKSPILRSPTAVAAACGYLISRESK